MSNSFQLCPTHFSGGAKILLGGASPTLRPLWLQAWVQDENLIYNFISLLITSKIAGFLAEFHHF